ncbi:AAA family ATPase [Thalassomonas sp. RHCl1]|uniref:ExeA family protein n=1 Tax=Thalassomonas sp. RHCl1 TaxID=2995320 RepID=UPI0032B1B761
MSVRHREALAHLTYGLGETGGFVLLTGEVGTGKTTVSRCLLDQLPENTQAAFILNPTLSSQELLATICDELKIRYRKTGATLKTLTDKIQEKLLKNHQAGLNTILIIDEAQHLQAEVLEQLRLLTNLETHTKKLLQVILIGQPELQQLLQRRDLRQLAQRITARYHLLPLNREEVAQYIQHRLAIAECQQPLFNRRAITTIHQLSKGIPRLINLLCDRALLGAYGENKQVVDKKLVLGASVEALGAELSRQPWWQKSGGKLALAAGLLALTLTLGFVAGNYQDNALAQQQESSLLADEANKALQTTEAAEQTRTSPETNWPLVIDSSRSLPLAVRHLFSLWRLQVEDELSEPCQVASSYELSCYWFKGTLPALLKLNYPAVFKFIDTNGVAFYGTLLGISQSGASTDGERESYRFQFNHQQLEIDKAWLDRYWQGGAVIFWQPPKNAFFEAVTSIGEQSPVELIQWLENKLSEKQQRPAREVQALDAMLKNQLRQFQRQYGIDSSEAREQTLMLLTNTVDLGQPIFK